MISYIFTISIFCPRLLEASVAMHKISLSFSLIKCSHFLDRQTQCVGKMFPFQCGAVYGPITCKNGWAEASPHFFFSPPHPHNLLKTPSKYTWPNTASFFNLLFPPFCLWHQVRSWLCGEASIAKFLFLSREYLKKIHYRSHFLWKSFHYCHAIFGRHTIPFIVMQVGPTWAQRGVLSNIFFLGPSFSQRGVHQCQPIDLPKEQRQAQQSIIRINRIIKLRWILCVQKNTNKSELDISQTEKCSVSNLPTS